MSETVAVFNGEKMTRREIEIAREAFMRGGQFAFSKIREARIGVDYHRDGEWLGLIPEAARRFPLPTITRARIARDPHSPQCDWKVICGCLTVRVGALPANATFQNYPRPGEAVHPTPERCRLWADLFANPNETVDDES